MKGSQIFLQILKKLDNQPSQDVPWHEGDSWRDQV